jgi:hypothetical protein
LAQHYNLQWKYSMDTVFLRERAYPWVREVARFIGNITVINELGERHLPISSSPEINDNSLSAWFRQTTNYDLALMKYALQIAAEMAKDLGLQAESEQWTQLLSTFPDYALTADKALMFARTMPYNQSHRHFSHLMAIQPLGLIKWEDGETAQSIIRQTIAELDRVGPSQWCGYSYSWLANLKAWARDGEGARAALDIFARAFCSSNSFHLNGDQTGKGYSGFTYRPFTLEGNFAYASGLQEMLLQSHAGYINLFPAIPASWSDCSFKNFRTQGAFLLDAEFDGGSLKKTMIRSEKGGETKIWLGAGNWKIRQQKSCVADLTVEGWLNLKAETGGLVEVYRYE